MKLKIKRLLPFMFASVLFSCQQNEAGSESVTQPVEVREFDLQNFSYEDVHELLAGNQNVINLRLKDGDLVKDVKALKLNSNLELGGEEQNGHTYFFEGAAEDSLCVIMDDAYASFKFVKNGKEFGYLALADTEEMEKILAGYQKSVAQTRSGSSSAVVGGAKGTSIKLNLSELQDTTKIRKEEMLPEDNTPEEMNEIPAAATRSAYYTQWPRGNTITIHLLRDKKDMPWEHELNWQINDMTASLRDIRSDINVKVWRSNTGYEGSTYSSSQDLYWLPIHARESKFPWKEATDHDIIMMVSHWGWTDGTVGRGYVNSYKLSRYNNPSAYGVAATSAVYAKTLAHEVGHILGAGHVAATPWWQFWVYDDVMVPSVTGKMGYRHMNSNNRNKIWNNLH